MLGLIGLWKTEHPPSDEEVKRIIEEGTMKKLRLMRVLLDTNVILDSLLQRAPWHQEADAILQAPSSRRSVLFLGRIPFTGKNHDTNSQSRF